RPAFSHSVEPSGDRQKRRIVGTLGSPVKSAAFGMPPPVRVFCPAGGTPMQKATLALAVALILALGAASRAEGQAAEKGKAPAEKMQTAGGTIAKLEAANRTLVVTVAKGEETRFVWTAETKINGTLSQGAKVTVRYTTLSDGQNVAHQISVGH